MISDEEWFEMRERYRQGVSISQLARETGLDRKTVRRHVRSLSPPERTRIKRGSKLDPYKDYIRGRLDKYTLTAHKLYEEICEQGYKGSYSLVKQYVRTVKGDIGTMAELRFETKPGEQGQVDWKDFGRMEMGGERVHLWAFIMVLGYSRAMYVEFTDNVRTDTFIQCHIHAFEYLGGYPKTILYDNTKNVVLKRALKSQESTWNPLYADFRDHYGFKSYLCRPGLSGAKTKGKVERAGRYIDTSFFQGLEFDSLSSLNRMALQWCDKANLRIHGTTHEVPMERLERERAYLLPIRDVTPYQIVLVEHRKVSRDCFVSYRTNRYSVPWRYAGREAKLHIHNDRMDVEIGGEIVCSHVVAEGTHRCIRVKEHFSGLMKHIKDKNRREHLRRLSGSSTTARFRWSYRLQEDVEVEVRDLGTYDALMYGGVEE